MNRTIIKQGCDINKIEFDIIDEYKMLTSIKPKDKEGIFVNSLLKADIEWRFEDIVSCGNNIELCIENICIQSDTFSLLLRLSVLAGRFDKLISKIDDDCLKLDNSKILNIVFKKYYKYIKFGEEFSLLDLFQSCTNGEDKSVILYLISTINKDEKLDFLKASIKEFDRNLSTIKTLYNLDYKLNIRELNNLYKINHTLFYSDKSNDIKNNEKKLDFSFKPLGGGNSVGASSYLIDIADNKLLIDCGIKFENNQVIFPDYKGNIDEIKKCDLCIITHAHLDHCGAIFKLYELNNSIRFIMTKETRELLKVNLENAMDNLFTDVSFDELSKRILILDFNKPYQWRRGSLTIELFRAGHILGASSIFLKTNETNVFITGDFCIDDQHTVKGIQIPENERVDIIITENTYGNKTIKDIKSRSMVYEQFKNYVLGKIKSGKNILIPAFAVGRSQEVISILKYAAEKNNFRIYVDGASIKISDLYFKCGLNVKGKSIHYVKSDFYDSKEDFIQQEVVNNKSCVISSSGMLQDGSASAVYARCLLGRSDTVCILTGYQSENTTGARLREQFNLESDRYIVIEDEKIKINCELKEFHLSAHCNNTEIMALAECLKPKNIILVHGEIEIGEKSIIHRILEKNKKINVIQSENNKLIKL